MNDCVMRGSYNLMFKSRMFLFHIGIRPRRRRTTTKPRWTVATLPPSLLSKQPGHDEVYRIDLLNIKRNFWILIEVRRWSINDGHPETRTDAILRGCSTSIKRIMSIVANKNIIINLISSSKNNTTKLIWWIIKSV